MLNELFNNVIELRKACVQGVDSLFNAIDKYEMGFLTWEGVKDIEKKNKENKKALKVACHKFFSEVIWTAEQSNMTLSEYLDSNSGLSLKWEGVETIVEELFPKGTLYDICCK